MVFKMQKLFNLGSQAEIRTEALFSNASVQAASETLVPNHSATVLLRDPLRDPPKSWTGLRFKITSIVAGSFIVLFLTQFAVVRAILLSNFARLEEDRALVNAARLQNAFASEISRLNDAALDYSTWDETYHYVKGQNPDYVESQLYDSVFGSVKINVVAIANRSGKLLVTKGRNFYTSSKINIPIEFQNYISDGAGKLENVNYGKPQGILLTTTGPLLVTSQPVLNSKGTDAGNAVLGMGRFIDPQMLRKLAAATQLSVKIYNYQDSKLPLEIRNFASQKFQGTTIAARVKDEDTVASYVEVSDVFGKPALILEADNHRNIYAYGMRSLNYYFWSTLLIGLAFCAIVLGLLERFVLSRLSCLSQELGTIGSQGRLSARVQLSGRDELTQFAKTVNHTLEQLERAQQALQTSEERYILAVRGAKDGIWDWDLHSSEVYFSERWKKILGYEEGELTSTLLNWFGHQHPQDLPSLKEAIDAHLKGESPYLEHEHRVIHKDGSERWVLCRGSAVRDRDGNPYRMAGSLTDISDRKAADLILARQAEELARSNQELEQFAYIASHDLQEPLRKIEAFGDRLKHKHGNTLEPQALDYLDRMQNAAGRMRALIQGLLSFSRVTTQSREFAPVQFSTLLKEVLEDLEVRIQETQAQIEIGPMPTLDVDALQMRQLFQNLICNALKFQRAGVTPLIKIDCHSTLEVNPSPSSESPAQPMCYLSVADNGIGFDEKYTDRIFKVFQRLHGRNEYEGTGIGLAVCTKIVERHGGQLTARSTPGQGSSFIVSLPL
jgi:PAS domain S-box-containing protein